MAPLQIATLVLLFLHHAMLALQKKKKKKKPSAVSPELKLNLRIAPIYTTLCRRIIAQVTR